MLNAKYQGLAYIMGRLSACYKCYLLAQGQFPCLSPLLMCLSAPLDAFQNCPAQVQAWCPDGSAECCKSHSTNMPGEGGLCAASRKQTYRDYTLSCIRHAFAPGLPHRSLGWVQTLPASAASKPPHSLYSLAHTFFYSVLPSSVRRTESWQHLRLASSPGQSAAGNAH